MKSIFFSFVLLLLSNFLFAQNISGIITDATTHQPLSYSTISLLTTPDSVQVKGTLASDNGGFRFEKAKAGKYLLAVQMMGYVKKTMNIAVTGADQTINIQLAAQATSLSEVTIKVAKPLVEHRADKTIFNVENSIVAIGNTGMELLSMTPLVNVQPGGSISIKGKQNVLVMLNGKIVPGETAVTLLQNMPAENIARIEVITTPSAKYDASASGGIVNIITKKGTGMGLNGTASLTAARTNYGKYSGGVLLNYRTGKVNVYGAANVRDAEGDRNEETDRSLNTGSQAEQLQTPTELWTHGVTETGKLGFDYEVTKNSTLSASVEGAYIQSNNRAKAVTYFSSKQLDSVLTADSKPGGNYNFTLYDLAYQHKLDNKGQLLNIDLNQVHYSGLSRQDMDGQLVDASGSNPVQYNSAVTRTNTLFNVSTIQSDYALPLDTNTLFEAGVKDLYTNSFNKSTDMQVNSLTNVPELSNTAYNENIAAGYFDLSRQLGTLKLQAGLRAEQTQATLSSTGLHENYFDLFPSLMADEKFSANNELTFSYASKINRPNYVSLIPFVTPIDRYTQEKGNPELKPAYSQDFELTEAVGSLAITLGYTYTKDAITDFIEQDEQTQVWTITKANFTREQNYNLSLVLPVAVTKWWNSNNTVVGLYNSFYSNDAGGSAYSQGKFSYNVNSMNTFTLPMGFKAELTGIYNSSSVYGLYNISHTSMVNAGLSKAFAGKKLNVKLGVNDIFNGSGYNLSTNAGILHMTGSSYYDSRRVSLSVSYKFGKKSTPAKERDHDDVKERLSM
ncbi:outer membrane beta-barrel family protein [Mucilaginibacter sp. L196]|uniref:outer membrane beta-barrel family protein n=1 Tax=Mucilaginibacter sp. L196 TaxID=1641870 RepID=UPI00131BD662|nr:outer membrane beta-barrel family protein [Mucilaginibacter sp. L196]